ncbi:MAG: toxin-antitoxin system HicB family antitoxin [Rhodomicrobium sp.]
MTALTIQLADGAAQRLRALANSRGISLDRVLEEVSEAALTAHDTEARSMATAAEGDREAALEILARLDRNELC